MLTSNTFQTLPPELFLCVCEYIEYKDILNLRQCNKQTYNLCLSLEPELITLQLKQTNDTKENMDFILRKYFHYEKQFKIYTCLTFDLHGYLTEHSYILMFIMYNYYRLLNIDKREIFDKINFNISYNIRLFTLLGKIQLFKPLVITCFKTLLQCHKQKQINLTINDIYNISTVCADSYVLSILFGQKVMNLIKSEFIDNTSTLQQTRYYIKNIVRYKYLNRTDMLLSINYNMIKLFLENHNMMLLNIIKQEETNYYINYYNYNNTNKLNISYYNYETKHKIARYVQEFKDIYFS